jgi:hypothetical protein
MACSARYHGIGLDEPLISNATEKAGMLLVQVERFMRFFHLSCSRCAFEIVPTRFNFIISNVCLLLIGFINLYS